MATDNTNPLRNAYLQTDLNCTDPVTGIKHSIIGLPSTSALLNMANSIFVDSVNGDSSGQRGTTHAFQTLPQALAVAQAGDRICIRGAWSISSAITVSVANLTIVGEGATLTASNQDSPYLLNITANGVTISDITLDANRSSSTTIAGGGTVQINNAQGVKLRRLTIKNTTARGINLTGANWDNFEISDCDISNMYQGIGDDQAGITGGGVRRGLIRNNRIYNTWTDGTGGGFPGGIKIDNTSSSGAILKIIVAENHVWGGHNNGPEEGISIQGNTDGTVVIGNTVSNFCFNYTFGGCSNMLVIGNTSRGGSFCAFENVDATNCTYSDNNIDGNDDTGTMTLLAGYSISTNFSTQAANLTINGGNIKNVPTAVHSDRCSGIAVSNLRTDTTSGPFGFQHTAGSISVNDCVCDIRAAASYGIYVDASSGTSDGFYYRNNVFRFVGTPGTQYALFHFFCDGAGATFNNVFIEGTISDSTNLFGSGYVDTAGPVTLNLTQTGNYPVTPTYGNGQLGFVDAQRWYNGFFTSNLVIGDGYTDAATATPATIDLGKSYSNTAGQHLKMLLYNSGGNVYGLGVSGNEMDLGVPSGSIYNFFVNNATVAKIAPNVITNGTITWTIGTGSPEGAVTAPVGSFYTRTDGGSGTTFYVKSTGSGNTGWVASVSAVSGGSTIASTSNILKGDGSGNAVAATQNGSGNVVLTTGAALVTPDIGAATATSVNKWAFAQPATSASLTPLADGCGYSMPEFSTWIGPRHIPQNSQSANYTTVLTDSGKNIYHPVGDASTRTFTIAANASVAYPIGTGIMFTNMSASNLTVAINSDTLTMLGTGTTGSRTVAQYGRLYVEKDTSTSWVGIPIANVT